MESDERLLNLKFPLHVASGMGELKEVKSLLDCELYHVNSKDIHDWTPLHYAAYGGQLNIIDYLIQCGADVHSRRKGLFLCYCLSLSSLYWYSDSFDGLSMVVL